LKTTLDITLDNDFPFEDATKDQFTVTAVDVDDTSYIRYLNVLSLSFTDDSKTLTMMFGGAVSGTFQIIVSHTEYGKIDTTDVFLDVRTTVTSVSP
jgi:hypothetical protein